MVLRQIMAVAAGYVLWSVLWLGYGMVLRGAAVLPADDSAAIDRVGPLSALLAGSVAASLLAGYVSAVIVRTGTPAPVLVLGLLLLGTGAFVEYEYWHLMPVWYHVIFLGLLVPICFAGARLRKR